MSSQKWDPTNLNEIFKGSKLSMAALSRNTGISYQTVFKTLKGETVPNQKTLKILADYFHVTSEYLFPDKYSINLVEVASSDPSDDKKEKRRSAARVTKRPYPYNLIFDIDPDKLDFSPDNPLTSDQIDGLNSALSELRPSFQHELHLRYAKCYKLAEIGETENIGFERVRTKIAHALRMMRHPRRLNKIKYGLLGNEIRMRDKYIRELEERIQFLQNEKREREAQLKRCGIDDLYFSIRPYHALSLYKLYTSDKIYAYASVFGLIGIRNIGVTSIDEIRQRMEERGYRLSEDEWKYGIHKKRKDAQRVFSEMGATFTEKCPIIQDKSLWKALADAGIIDKSAVDESKQNDD